MKITYGKLTLCADGESPKNFSASLRKKIQSDELIESDNVLIADRGNVRNVISFTLEKAHKSPAEAHAALFDIMHSVSEESTADLEITCKSETRIYANAALTRCAASAEGVITRHFLEFAAGRKI